MRRNGSNVVLTIGVLATLTANADAQLFRRNRERGSDAQQAPPAAPASPTSRSARTLLRTGLDYLDRYDDPARAFEYLAEAKRAEHELTQAEAQQLKAALERARKQAIAMNGVPQLPRRPRAAASGPPDQALARRLPQEPRDEQSTGAGAAKADLELRMAGAPGPGLTELPEVSANQPITLETSAAEPRVPLEAPSSSVSRSNEPFADLATEPRREARQDVATRLESLLPAPEAVTPAGLEVPPIGEDRSRGANVSEPEELGLTIISQPGTPSEVDDQRHTKLDIQTSAGERPKSVEAPAANGERVAPSPGAQQLERADQSLDATPRLPEIDQPAMTDALPQVLGGTPAAPAQHDKDWERSLPDLPELDSPPGPARLAREVVAPKGQAETVDHESPRRLASSSAELEAAATLPELPLVSDGATLPALPESPSPAPALRSAVSQGRAQLPAEESNLPALPQDFPEAADSRLPNDPAENSGQSYHEQSAPGASGALEPVREPVAMPTPPPVVPAPASEAAEFPPLPGDDRWQTDRPLRAPGSLNPRLALRESELAGSTIRLHNPDTAREIAQLARQQDEDLMRNRPPGVADLLASDLSDTDEAPIPRAPSPTEARPIQPIPVPEEYVPLEKRMFEPYRKYWAAGATCHMPLYFQDAVLERYGQSVEQALGPHWGKTMSYPLDDPRQSSQRNQLLQPAYSTGLFIVQMAAWPFNAIMNPPWEAEYDLGYYRPGDPIPPDSYYWPKLGIGPPLRGSKY